MKPAAHKKERRTDPGQPILFTGTCSGPGCLSLSSKHSVQTWNLRREHAASELFLCHTHTQPSPLLPRFAPTPKQSTTPSDPSVDPSSFFSPIVDDAGPFSASSKITPLSAKGEFCSRPSRPLVQRRRPLPPARPPRLRPWPRRRVSSERPLDSILPFDPARSAWSLRLQQQQLSVVSSLDPPPTARRTRPPNRR
jgi:hypothetical protein